MMYFKRMCERVAKQKPANKGEFDEKQFFDMASEARSIVFHDVDDLVRDKTAFDLSQPLPFRTCAIEFHGKASILHGEKGIFECMLVREVGPQQFDIILTFAMERGVSYQVYPHDDEGNIIYHKIISNLLMTLNNNMRGQEETSDFVRVVNQAGNNQKRFIRKIIHICPKHKTKEVSQKLTVDWSHRWEVRGHWRDIEGLGKDRYGDYCVQGKTWVTDYVKGPEELPLVRKTRYLAAHNYTNKEIAHG